jgi:ubiquinone/menaquinone biosynthesis C-methylase UbiE
MSTPFAQLVTRLSYGAAQLPRVAWYVGHGLALRYLADFARRAEGAPPRPRASARSPERAQLYADMARLLLQDLANVEAGIYPLPDDRDGSLLTLLERSRLFFADVPAVYRRRNRGGHSEVLTEVAHAKRPRYYLQNFHFQSGGWLTDDSARRYDTQVEVLFGGAANAIRRQALVPLHEAFKGRDQRRLRLLDVGCGTGRLLEFVKQVWPRLPALGVDLSEPYLREARRHLRQRSRVGLVVANGESLPVADASQDAVTSVFVFHELPPPVRRTLLGEFARVLRPGGRLVLLDSLQRGDRPDYDGMLELFPHSFHEPYYASYLDEDFPRLAGSCGLAHVRDTHAYLSKVMVYDKAAA